MGFIEKKNPHEVDSKKLPPFKRSTNSLNTMNRKGKTTTDKLI